MRPGRALIRSSSRGPGNRHVQAELRRRACLEKLLVSSAIGDARLTRSSLPPRLRSRKWALPYCHLALSRLLRGRPDRSAASLLKDDWNVLRSSDCMPMTFEEAEAALWGEATLAALGQHGLRSLLGQLAHASAYRSKQNRLSARCGGSDSSRLRQPARRPGPGSASRAHPKVWRGDSRTPSA
jgi:hypothetical protein